MILLSARAGEEAAIEGLWRGPTTTCPSRSPAASCWRASAPTWTCRACAVEAAAELRAEQSRLEQTLQQMPAGVMLAEAPSRRIVLANRQAAEILGHGILPYEDGGDYDGYELYTLAAASASSATRVRWRAPCSSGRSSRTRTCSTIRGDGRTIIVRISAAPIRDEAGDVVGGVLVFQDVSERVRSERLLAAQRDILALIANGVSLERVLDAIVRCVEDAVRVAGQERDHAALRRRPSPGARRGAEPAAGVSARPPRNWRSGPTPPARPRSPVETVIVSDTLTAPAVERLSRAGAASMGMRVCWSTPLRADDGELVGHPGRLL